MLSACLAVVPTYRCALADTSVRAPLDLKPARTARKALLESSPNAHLTVGVAREATRVAQRGASAVQKLPHVAVFLGSAGAAHRVDNTIASTDFVCILPCMGSV